MTYSAQRVRIGHHMALIKVIVDGKVVLETNDYLYAMRQFKIEANRVELG